MFEVPEEEVQFYIAIPPPFTNGVVKDLAVFVVYGDNYFTHYGIYEGMLLIFELGAKYVRGHLSCFLNCAPKEDESKYRVSDVPLKGYRHIGRLIASVRNYEV